MLFFFFFGHKACRILAPQPKIEPASCIRRQCLNHWALKEILGIIFHSQLLLRAYFQRQTTPSYLIVHVFQGNGKPGSFSCMPGAGSLLAGHVCQCCVPITVRWSSALNDHTSLSINASWVTFIEEI